MEFLYHWCKIRNVVCQLTQIIQSQRDPWLIFFNDYFIMQKWIRVFFVFLWHAFLSFLCVRIFSWEMHVISLRKKHDRGYPAGWMFLLWCFRPVCAQCVLAWWPAVDWYSGQWDFRSSGEKSRQTPVCGSRPCWGGVVGLGHSPKETHLCHRQWWPDCQVEILLTFYI